jgi:hypothetical protein
MNIVYHITLQIKLHVETQTTRIPEPVKARDTMFVVPSTDEKDGLQFTNVIDNAGLSNKG